VYKSASIYLASIMFLSLFPGIHPELTKSDPLYTTTIQQDPSDKRLLLNGRIWHNQYPKAFNDQFFLTNKILKGSVIFNGNVFTDLDLKYDIADDELILNMDTYPVISLNKEMVDSFTLSFGNRDYLIINAGNDSSNVLRGYVNVLYVGPTALYVKYSKKLRPLAVDGRFDLFQEEHRTYIRKGSEVVIVKGKKKLFELLDDRRKEIRAYIKSNRIRISNKDPNSYIPLLKYYDTLRK